MKKNLLFIICIFIVQTLVAQSDLNVYFLAVGSGHYEQDAKKFREKGFVPYDNLPEANLSASIMAEFFSRFAMAKGKVLLSEHEKPLSKASLLAGIDSVGALIRREKPKNPFFILYYCGHGISEDVLWNQYLIPGNYTYIPGTKDVSHLEKNLIWLRSLDIKLNNLAVPFMVLIDCCRKAQTEYGFNEKNLQYFFSKENAETFGTIIQVLQKLDELSTDKPFLFSISPGKSAPVVDIPDKALVANWGLDSSFQIGPICRRTLKLVDLLKDDFQISSLGFVKLLTTKGIDSGTPTSVSNLKEGANVKEYPLFKSPKSRN